MTEIRRPDTIRTTKRTPRHAPPALVHRRNRTQSDANGTLRASETWGKRVHLLHQAPSKATAKIMSSTAAKQSIATLIATQSKRHERACTHDGPWQPCRKRRWRRCSGGGSDFDVRSTPNANEEVEEHLWGEGGRGQRRCKHLLCPSSVLPFAHAARCTSLRCSRDLARARLPADIESARPPTVQAKLRKMSRRGLLRSKENANARPEATASTRKHKRNLAPFGRHGQ